MSTHMSESDETAKGSNLTRVILAVVGLLTAIMGSGYFAGNQGVSDKLAASQTSINAINENAVQISSQVANTMLLVAQSEQRVSRAVTKIEHAEPVLESFRFHSNFKVVDKDKNWLVRAFIETGSSNPYVLATLKDNHYLGDRNLTMWASARECGQRKGILLTVTTSLSQENPIPDDYMVEVNLFQKYVSHYQTPRFYPEVVEEGCAEKAAL